jgi:hypothetical protein
MIRIVCLVACLGGCMERKTCPLTAEPGIADEVLRDPSTGQCQSFGVGGSCDPSCGPCPALTEAIPADPDWGTCNGGCAALTETQCLATPDCHASYQDDSAASPVFWGCWDLPRSGVVHGACAGLDAQTCTEHDDCASLYTGPVNQPQNFVPSFERCIDEPATACSSVDCGA